MRRPRSMPTGGPATLVLLFALLLCGLPGATPFAVAQEGTGFRLMPSRADAAPPALSAARAQVVGTAPGDAPASAQAASGPEGVPLVALPQGGGSPEPDVVELETQISPPNAVRPQGLTPEQAARITFGPANSDPTLRPTTLSGACQAMIRNAQIDGYQDPDTGFFNIYNWTVIQPVVYVETNTYFSYPYALTMEDADEAQPDGRPGRDEDWFGQDFYFPTDGEGFLIEFNLYYPDDGGNVGFDSVDFGYVELYRIDDNGFLIDEVPGDQFVQGIVVQRIDVVPQPNTWYRVPFFFAQDPNDPNDDALFNSIKGQRVALVFDQDGDRLPPYENAIIDNPQVTVCPTA